MMPLLYFIIILYNFDALLGSKVLKFVGNQYEDPMTLTNNGVEFRCDDPFGIDRDCSMFTISYNANTAIHGGIFVNIMGWSSYLYDDISIRFNDIDCSYIPSSFNQDYYGEILPQTKNTYNNGSRYIMLQPNKGKTQ